MITASIFRILWFIGLILLQVLICNNICILGYATPFLYIYFILKLNAATSTNKLMLWGFFLGLIIDIFSDTPGMNTAATVFLAFLRPYLLHLFIPRDSMDAIIPSSRTMGKVLFYKYLFAGVFMHHLALLTIEFFSFSGLLGLILRIMACSLLTLTFISAVEGVRK